LYANIRLSAPRYLRPDMERFWGLDKTILSSAINGMVDYLYTTHKHLIENLNIPRIKGSLRDLADSVGRKLNLNDASECFCFGFIDGTFRRIARPVQYQRVSYSGHHRAHGLRYQGVVCPSGIIESLFGPIEGRHHDKWILDESEILRTLENAGFKDEQTGNTFYLYGDAAYPLHPNLLSPIRSLKRTPVEAEFNRSYSSVRVSVEHSFSLITQIWTALDFKRYEQALLISVGTRYKVAAILTNIYTILNGGNKISSYFGCRTISLQEYFYHPDAPTHDHGDAAQGI
jgi:hypothetical protein